MSTTVSYKGSTIATAENQTKTLETAGTWLEDDITIVDVTSGGGGITPTGTINITTNGTHDVTNYASASVAVPTGTTPTGTKQISITQNGTTTEDVTNYANAEITVNVSGGTSGWDADDIASRASIDGSVVCSTATKLMPWCFAYSRITSFSSDTVTNMENTDSNGRQFFNCTSLTSVSIPNVTTQLGANAFQRCSSLQSVNIPNALTGMASVFDGCSSLQEVTFAKSVAVGNSFFYNCSALTKVDLSSSNISTTGAINSKAFYGCGNLITLILRKSTIFTLGNVDAFNGTPFASGGSGGTIYVPSSLISAYQSASNWSTVNGYGTITWQAIEGSQYE